MTVAINPGEPLEGANVLRREKLFGKWQEQGDGLGWGPRQAAALLGKAKRHRPYLYANGVRREKLNSGLTLVRGQASGFKHSRSRPFSGK